MTGPPKDHRPVWVCALLLAATLAAYGPIFRCGFVNFDDTDYVLQNSEIRAGLTPQALQWAFSTYYADNWHPVTWLSHILDFSIYGLNPAGMHLTNLTLHAANTLVLFLLFRRMTGALWRSAFVAALFALHPLHVESVAWISERKDVLSTFFGLLAVWAYLRYLRFAIYNSGVDQPPRGYSGGFYLLSVLLFAFSLMSKPMLVTLPFVLLLLDYWPLQRLRIASLQPSNTLPPQDSTTPSLPHPGIPLRRLLLEKVPFLALAAADSILTFRAQQAGHAIVSLDFMPAQARIGYVLVSYLRYLGKAFWPVNLCPFYPPELSPAWESALAAALLLGLTVPFLCKRRCPYLLVGWLWFLGTLVPVIGFVRVGGHSIADRYMYLPLVGLSICLAWGADDLLRTRPGRKPFFLVSAVALLLACAGATFHQVSYWRTSLTLFGRALAVTRDNVVAHYQCGMALAGEGRFKEAIYHYEQALRIFPRLARAHVRLAEVLGKQGNHEAAAAHSRTALGLEPDNAEAHDTLGVALQNQGKLAEAEIHFREALRLDPGSAWFRRQWASFLLRQGKLDEAIEQFQRSLRAWPYAPEVHLEYASALAQKGALDAAVAEYATALRLDPTCALAHYYWGEALQRQNKTSDAIAHWREALRLKPDWLELRNNLAWVLATSPDPNCRSGSEAVGLAEATRLLDPNDFSYLDTLAAAYAAAGRFADATNAIQRAIALAEAAGQTNPAARFRTRLDLYRSGKPFYQ